MKLSVDKVKIGIHFEIGEPPYVLQDTLFFTEEEYASLTPEQINAMKVDRYEKWQKMVIEARDPPTPLPSEEPITEEFLAE